VCTSLACCSAHCATSSEDRSGRTMQSCVHLFKYTINTESQITRSYSRSSQLLPSPDSIAVPLILPLLK
jgi:hypothetical protein